MKNLLCGHLSICFLLCAGVAGTEVQQDAWALVDKAIGGAKRLAKYNAATWEEKGTYYGMGDGLP